MTIHYIVCGVNTTHILLKYSHRWRKYGMYTVRIWPSRLYKMSDAVYVHLWWLFVRFTKSIIFQSKESREIGCGIYLLTSSIKATVTVIVFAFKFFILIVSERALITNCNYLSFNCMLLHFLVKFLLNAADEWLNICVSVERASITVYDVNFNNIQRKKSC